MAGHDGRFEFHALAPGHYKIFAWENVDLNPLRYDPDFLRPFESQGQAIHIDENGKLSVRLKLIESPQEH